MNKFPIWKYALVVFVAIAGFIYAAPNLYPPDPAIQINAVRASASIDKPLVDRVTTHLESQGISVKAQEVDDASLLVRLTNKDDQRQAKNAVESLLGINDYVTAVNLAPTTPEWLLNLGAGPLKLGLDLAGGVHFLLEVDTVSVLERDLKSIETQIQQEIRKQKLFGTKAKVDKASIVISAPDEASLNAISEFTQDTVSEIQFTRDTSNGQFILSGPLNDSFIREREDYAVQQNLTTLRNRVNEIGVSEPIVQRQGRNRIVVQLPGIQDTAAAKDIIGKTANLEFRLEADSRTLSSQRERFPYKDENEQAMFGGAELEKKLIVKGDNVSSASAGFDPQTNQPQVNISLDSAGAKRMMRTTGDNLKRRMGVLFIEYDVEKIVTTNDQGEEVVVTKQTPRPSIISLATIQGQFGKNFVITGLDSPAEASRLALLLRAGALAAPMGFLEERTIGPSLGEENIEKGFTSVIIGMSLVLFFMLVFYKVFGIAANIALALNILLLTAVMSFVGATLTLPGIAGIVLTIGMAVDANVLIFSRIKEEIKAGSSPQVSIHNGFESAFTTILDANATTFIVAIILYAIGTGPVKGFAVTLAIGIITSMFTAIVGTRAVVNLIYGGRKVNKLMI